MGTWQVRQHNDGWRVITPGGTRACAPADSQHEAIQKALDLLAYEGGQLLVHTEAGQSICSSLSSWTRSSISGGGMGTQIPRDGRL
ncbi:DUF2188 domain-containing protein [Saccharopolyspora sp. NPDC002686]|uniref:DUF2188 domain-containing protein n=1 Tax=Saccharopolyspora sp. NPDC002686 TaxID=3154541 RepID=UPI003329B77F